MIQPAMMWNDALALRFPHVDHTDCLQRRRQLDDQRWEPFYPPLCLDTHCTRCGSSVPPRGHDCG